MFPSDFFVFLGEFIDADFARVAYVRSCPPRRSSGAGVGVGMLRGKGFLDILVSWFLDFKVSWFQSFKDLPNFHFMPSGRY